MPEFVAVEAPQTIEGWYTLHDVYTVDWSLWHALDDLEREHVGSELSSWLEGLAAYPERGDSKLYSVVTQKGDLMFCHYRSSPAALNEIELQLRKLRIYEFLAPAYSYLSVIEVSLYEVQAMAMRRLSDRGIAPGTPEHDEALAKEMEVQKERMNERLFRRIPPQRYICFYPMNKRRGEQVNWYALPLKDRRAIMRGHGSIGHKYADVVTQVIGGSTGLDDWEWGVSLHAEDPLSFKKLIYEMRFDPASSWFAEFGPFYVGVHIAPTAVAALMEGRLE
ncbi:MAG TPA: hydrogen peroxide-dependent heme synthase [Candidatus Limnocylindrales bacterium]|nr:hydrogen peroxide-dependent heme synthase [Candidatus Limnocylindrales bacterium]